MDKSHDYILLMSKDPFFFSTHSIIAKCEANACSAKSKSS